MFCINRSSCSLLEYDVWNRYHVLHRVDNLFFVWGDRVGPYPSATPEVDIIFMFR